jgi:hypothetical protein
MNFLNAFSAGPSQRISSRSGKGAGGLAHMEKISEAIEYLNRRHKKVNFHDTTVGGSAAPVNPLVPLTKKRRSSKKVFIQSFFYTMLTTISLELKGW